MANPIDIDPGQKLVMVQTGVNATADAARLLSPASGMHSGAAWSRIAPRGKAGTW